jgi:cytochrome c oxidase assembly protein subunit 15
MNVSRRLLQVALALALVVVGASSYLRLAGNGLGCAPWPACYGTAAATESANRTTPVSTLRLVHRVAATAFLLVATVGVVLGWRGWRRAQRLQGALLLLVTLGLAVIGRFTPSALPWITWLNVLGGFLLIAVTLALLSSRFGDRAADAGAKKGAPLARQQIPLAPLLLLFLVAQVLGGTLLSSRLAAAACVPACAHAPRGDLVALWNPLHTGDATSVAGDPGGAAMLNGLHRIGGLLLALAALAAAALAPRSTGRAAIALAASVVLVLGFTMTHWPNAALGAAHALAAAVLLAGLARLLPWQIQQKGTSP